MVGHAPTVGDLMTADGARADLGDSISHAARLMRDLDVQFVPVCDADGYLCGLVTDREIVVRCVADEADPSATSLGDFVVDHPAHVSIDAAPQEALRVMVDHDLRRIPVTRDGRLVGVVSQGDVARELAPESFGTLLGALSEAAFRPREA